MRADAAAVRNTRAPRRRGAAARLLGVASRTSLLAQDWKFKTNGAVESRMMQRPLGVRGEEEPRPRRAVHIRPSQHAIQRRKVVAALAAARELPQLSLHDALELTPGARVVPRKRTSPVTDANRSVREG